MYTLGGGIHEEQGWGRADETFAVKDELAAYGVGPAWFGLGDRDLATHIVRTQMLDAGYPLSAGHRGAVRPLGLPDLGVRLLPMSDDRVETHVVIDDAEAPGGPAGRALPGVLGAAARRARRARDRRRRRRGRQARARACSRRSRPPTWCCCRRPTRS